MNEQPEESEVRAMRDQVFGPEPKYCGDANWEACRHRWMQPEAVAWLRERSKTTLKNV